MTRTMPTSRLVAGELGSPHRGRSTGSVCLRARARAPNGRRTGKPDHTNVNGRHGYAVRNVFGDIYTGELSICYQYIHALTEL